MKKRFNLTGNKETRDFYIQRKKTIRGIINDLSLIFPSLVGLTLFGSTVKGTARPITDPDPSDLDGYFIFDLPKEHCNFKYQKQENFGEESCYLEVSCSMNFKGHFFQSLNEKTLIWLKKENIFLAESTLNKVLEDIFPLPISYEIIDFCVEKLNIFYEKKLNNFNFSGYFCCPLNLQALFHFAVGDKIYNYRSYLIQKLIELGEIGRLIWEDSIILAVISMEYPNPLIQNSIYFPRSFFRAVQIYK